MNLAIVQLRILSVFSLCYCFWCCYASPYNCTIAATGQTVLWLQRFGGEALAGYCHYYANGTLLTYLNDGVLVGRGKYKITENEEYCLERETYIWPSDVKDNCNTFSVNVDPQGLITMVGCSIFGDNCTSLPNCNDPNSWNYWWSSVVIGDLPK